MYGDFDLYSGAPRLDDEEENPLLRAAVPLFPQEPSPAPLPQEPPPEAVPPPPEGFVLEPPSESKPEETVPPPPEGFVLEEPPKTDTRKPEDIPKEERADFTPPPPPEGFVLEHPRDIGAGEAFSRELTRAGLGLGEAVNKLLVQPFIHAASQGVSEVAPDSALAKGVASADEWWRQNMVNAVERTRQSMVVDPRTEKEGFAAGTAGVLGAFAPDLIAAGITGGALPAESSLLRASEGVSDIAPTVWNAVKSYFPTMKHAMTSFILPSARAGTDAQTEAASRGATPAQQVVAFIKGFFESDAAAALPMSVTSELASPITRFVSRTLQAGLLAEGQGEMARGLHNLTSAPDQYQAFDPWASLQGAIPMALLGGIHGGVATPVREARPGEIQTGAISPAQGGTGALMGEERFMPGHLPPPPAEGLAPGVTVTPAPTGEVPGAEFAPPPVPLPEGHIAVDGVGAGEVRLSPEAQNKLNSAVLGTPEAVKSFNDAFVAENPAHPPLDTNQVKALASQMDRHFGNVDSETAGATIVHKVASDNEKVSGIADEHAQKLEAVGAPKTAEALKAVAQGSNDEASVTAAQFLAQAHREADDRKAAERVAAGLPPIEEPVAAAPVRAPEPSSEARPAVVVGGQVFTGDTPASAHMSAHQAVGPDAMTTAVSGWVDPATGHFTSHDFNDAHQALGEALTQSGGDTEHPAVGQAGSQLAEAHARDAALNEQIVRPAASRWCRRAFTQRRESGRL